MPDIIGNRYEVIRRLGEGQGAMAEVYLANDKRLPRKVAVKLLPRHYLQDADFKRRFQKEAETWSQLEHDNIVRLYDYDPDAEQPYMVMQFIEGQSLETYLQERGSLPLHEALRLLRPIGSALEAIHRRDIIHRDLKPANILLDKDLRAYLTDFGIAKPLEGTAALTGTLLAGTPAYMSPEQWRGEKELDGRTDQYALAVMLYQMLGGEPPFKADTLAAMMHQHLTQQPAPIQRLNKDIPKAAAKVLERGLSKKLKQRYLSISMLFSELEDAAGVEATHKPEPARKKPAAKPTKLLTKPERKSDQLRPKRKPAPTIIYAAATILVMLAAWVLVQSQAGQQATQTSTPAASTQTNAPTAATTPTLDQATQDSLPSSQSQMSLRAIPLYTLQSNLKIGTFAFSPNGSLLASGARGPGQSGTANIWLAENGELADTLVASNNYQGVQNLAFSPNGQLLVTATLGSGAVVWRLTDGILLHEIEAGRSPAIAFSPDGVLLASLSSSGILRIWQASTGELLHTNSQGLNTGGSFLGFSSDGRWIVTNSVGGRADGEVNFVYLWNASDGKLWQALPAEENASVAFSPNSTLLAVSQSNKVLLFDSNSGQQIQSWQTSGTDLSSLIFTPDGQFLVVQGKTAVETWRVEDGSLVYRTSHPAQVSSISISALGNLIASGTDDNRINIWEPTTGKILVSLVTTSTPLKISFSPDGNLLAALLQEEVPTQSWLKVGTVQTWQLIYENE